MKTLGDRQSREKATKPARLVALLLLILFSTLIFGYLWWGRFEYYDNLILGLTYSGTIGCVVTGHLFYKDSLSGLGLRLDNFFEGLRTALVPTVLLGLLIGLAALLTGRAHWELGKIPLSYLPGSFLQQYVLQAFLLQRFRTLTSNSLLAVVGAALLFGVLHLPNVPLMLVSFAGALIWCRIFLRVPNLPAVALSHVLLGILLAAGFKHDGLDQFRVGKGGYPYTIFGDGVFVAAGYDEKGAPFIATLPGQDRSHSSRVRIYRPNGEALSEWTAFERYGFSGNIAVGDLGFGPGDEVAVAPGPGVRNPPEIRIFTPSGRELSRFTVPDRHGYGAFVTIANGSLLVAPGPGPERAAECFDFGPDGNLKGRWTLSETGFVNSVKCDRSPLGSWDADASGVMAWPTFVSVNHGNVRFYDGNGKPFNAWTAYPTSHGLSLSRIRLGPGRIGVMTAPGPVLGHPPHIKVFAPEGSELRSLFPYRSPQACGSNLAAVDIDGDGIDEIVLGEGNCKGLPPDVRIVSLDGEIIHHWTAW